MARQPVVCYRRHLNGESSNSVELVGRQAINLETVPSARMPMKLLLNVNVEGSFGPIPVVIHAEETVEGLVKAVIEIYVKEKRRPLLAKSDHRLFELHYSTFSLDSLKMEEKLMNLGNSRKFYLCRKKVVAAITCKKEAETIAESGFFMSKLLFLL
ncbi:uncharacterized protein LOC124910832 [Impatiens glandulifera]|uniref:uncharacterized protein LOC124910832 n=1 Tax=Impatiens glandulifera TaxID=253017 RepID=UPI001FB0E3B6|nr:uncharacterized protein LOC124910832 [Impatiens glandulifera]